MRGGRERENNEIIRCVREEERRSEPRQPNRVQKPTQNKLQILKY